MVFESLYPASGVLDERGRPVRHIKTPRIFVLLRTMLAAALAC